MISSSQALSFLIRADLAAKYSIVLFITLATLVTVGCDSETKNQPGTILNNSDKLALAWEHIHMANWPAAEIQLNELLLSDPENKISSEAHFALGHLWQNRNPGSDLNKSRKYYEKVIDEFPNSQSRPWAMLALIRMVELPPGQPEYNSTVGQMRRELPDKYQAIIDQYPGHNCSHEAALRKAMLQLENIPDKLTRQQGAEYLQGYLGIWPDNYLAATMYTALGRYYQSIENYKEAVKFYIAAANAGLPTEMDAAMEYYRIARVAEHKLGDVALARKWYLRVVKDAPRDFRYFPSLQSLKRCNLLLGLPENSQEAASE